MYQITNLVNNKIYVGVHKTTNLDDGYMGSGTIIRSAISKHRISNFEKVILEFFGNQEAMYAKEKEVVDEEFLLREDVYNLRCGGYGGFDYINNNGLNHRLIPGYNAKVSPFGKEGYEWIKELSKEASTKPDVIARRVRSFIDNGGSIIANIAMVEASKSLTAREKRKETLADRMHQQGDKNSSFGTMWITNGIKPIKIKKTEAIPDGYYKGRK